MKALGVCSSTNLSKVELTLSTSASTRREVGKCRAGEASAWRPRVWARVVSPREGVTPAGFSRLWYLLIKSMTEVKESSLSSSTEERDSGRSPSWSLGEDDQKRASFSDVEGADSTGLGGFARWMDEPSLTVRESEMSSGRIVESMLRDALDTGWGGGGLPRESASSDLEEDDEDRQFGEWLALRLLLELLAASRRWCLPLDRLRGGRSERLPSAANESEAEGLPVEGKPVVVSRPEPLACSQAKGWGQGLPPCQVARA